MADPKSMNQSTGKTVPAFTTAVQAAPVKAPIHPRRNPGWCLGELPEGKTSQDMSIEERKASALQHEAKWKRRYGQAGVVENPWTRGPGG